MPESYNTVIIVVATSMSIELTDEFVKERLLDADMRVEKVNVYSQ